MKRAIQVIVNHIQLEPPFLKEVVRQVVASGWSHITWRNGYTGLHAAAEVGCAEVVPLLVALGADPFVMSAKGKTALDIAKKKGHRACEQLLRRIEAARSLEELMRIAVESRAASLPQSGVATPIKHAQALVSPANAPTPREWSQVKDDSRRLRFILLELVHLLRVEPVCEKAVVHVAVTGQSGTEVRGWYTTALHLAAELGRTALVPLLVRLGADPATPDSAGRTALDTANAHGHWACAWALAQAGGGQSAIALEERVQGMAAAADAPCAQQQPCFAFAPPPAAPPTLGSVPLSQPLGAWAAPVGDATTREFIPQLTTWFATEPPSSRWWYVD